jgi:phage tail sheath protein FI
MNLSAGVSVKESDLSTTVPQLASSITGMVGAFTKGPCKERTLVTSVRDLEEVFGKPTDANYIDWFTAYNILQYNQLLYVVRAENTTMKNSGLGVTNSYPILDSYVLLKDATSIPSIGATINVKSGSYINTLPIIYSDSTSFVLDAVDGWEGTTTAPSYEIDGTYHIILNSVTTLATVGDSLAFVSGAYTNYGSVLSVDSTLSSMVVDLGTISWVGPTISVEFDNSATFSATYSAATVSIQAFATIGTATISLLSVDDIRLNNVDGFDVDDITFNTGENLRIISKYPGTYGNDIKISMCPSSVYTTATVYGSTKFVDLFDTASINSDEIAIVVHYPDPIDTSAWTIVERFIVSTNPTAKDYNGSTTWVGEYITRNSNYIAAFSGNSATFSVPVIKEVTLTGGSLGTYTKADFDECYDLFSNPEEFDFSIIVDCHNTAITTNSDLATLQGSIVDKFVGVGKRNDVFIVLSPFSGDVLKKTPSQAQANLETYVKTILNKPSSYAALYGNWKYQYDRYNDKYRWLPLSGDVAGVFASSDALRELWFAPAGLTRGQIKNCIKLAFNPDKGVRDILYKNNINPVVSFPGEGFVVWGQKTLLTQSSAFSRVDVRRLFMYMEKAISIASRYFLFEKNTAFTRRQWLSVVEPFLADIKAKEGLYDYRVICDETNNNGTVIDRNEMVGDIYLQPTKSIEFIQLNFVNTKTGVNFDEIIKRG